MTSLFIPLKREYFEAFERGEKIAEYRIYTPDDVRCRGPRWNEKTCFIGRPVVLSCGYGKARRLRGTINGFAIVNQPMNLKGWAECYGDIGRAAACIGIKLEARK